MNINSVRYLLVGGSIFTQSSMDFMENIEQVEPGPADRTFRVRGIVNGEPRWTTVDFR